jgi:hypothetical protein
LLIMSYVRTNVLIAQLRSRLEALPLSPDSDEKLFQRVGVFGANRLVEAIEATVASEARVCFIVPGGDTHSNSQPDALLVHSRRTTRLALIIADRVMDAASDAAVVGGPHTAGILDLKDAVIEHLTREPLPLPGVALVPAEGEPFIVSRDEPATLGREAWLQWLTTYAGAERVAVP